MGFSMGPATCRLVLRLAEAPRSEKKDRVKWFAYASLAISIASMVFVAVLAVQVNTYLRSGGSATTVATTTTFQPIVVTGNLITPPTSLADAPPILAVQPFGSRLTDINVALNATELAVFNNASDSYFVTAAQMYLNHTLSSTVGAQTYAAPAFIVNGKPTVTYLGAISCVYCGENRWAMALALGRFGSFQQLFWGYSAIQDGDVPTIYWAPGHYNASTATEFGNFYSGTYVNFVSMEYSSPINQGFNMGTLSYFQQEAVALGNPVYANATKILIGLNNYVGTPDTIWGSYSVPGADAINFGTATSSTNTTIPMASLTHEQVLASLAKPSTGFAWTEYAAADYYIALVCASPNVMAPVCSLPSVSTMVTQLRG